jgi:transglutaminase-like putative cysteine protease
VKQHGSVRVCAVALLIASASLWRAPSVKADEWKPITPEELKLTSVTEAPGAPAIYLYRQVDRDDNGRTSNEYNYVRIKVLTEEGRDQANVIIPFEKGRQSVINIRARTIQPDGKITEFDGKTYEQMVEKTKGLKYLAKTFTLPDVHAGSIIEYHYTIDFAEYWLFHSYWLLSEDLFTKKAVFSLKPYSRYPWNVQWSWPAGLPQGTEPPKEGPDHIVRMTSENIPAFVEEDHMPPPNELKFRVLFTYKDEPFESDTDKYWKQFAKKKSGQIEGFVDKRKAMEEVVASIVSAGDPPEVKLRKIYDRVQQIPNASYMPAKSEEQRKRENIKENKDVEDLWKRQYGNGWDLTWLFLGLARGAGFEAYPCLVSGRGEYFFRKERMNGAELDANVVLVKVNGKDQYFDPGAAFTPYGLLPWMETGVSGLRLDRNGGTWIQTDLPMSGETRVRRTAQLKLTPEGDLEGKLTVAFTGLEALNRRLRQRNEDETARKKNLEEEVKDYIPAGSEVELTDAPDWKNGNLPLQAEFSLKVPGWSSAAGKRALLPTGLFGASEKHMFEHANRVWPVYFRYPFETDDDITVTLPEGWKVDNQPKDMDRDAKAVQYKLEIKNEGNTVHIKRLLRSELVMVGKENYSILRNFYQLVKAEDEEQVVLLPGGTSAAK